MATIQNIYNININNENNIYNPIIDNNINNNNNIVENNISNNTTNDEYVKKKYRVSKIKRDGKTKTSTKEKDKDKKNEELDMPVFSSHNTFLTKSYTIPQLKEICKFYKLKVTGNKQVLINKIYNFLYFSSHALIIQKVWRKNLFKVYNNLRGPARFNRSLCVNETDFFSMEPIKDIPFDQFFSYKDVDGKIYGFDIISLYNLLDNEDLKDSNPYNRSPIPYKAKTNFKRLLSISKIMGTNLHMSIEVEKEEINDPIKIIELRTISIFREMDNLGNYTNPAWFLQLNQRQVVKFLHELYDIWCFRAHLDDNTMIEICPPNGRPFQILDMNSLNNIPLINIKTLALVVMEQFVNSGIDREFRILGSNYVLCALTLVSTNAADALPWLYQSVSHYE
jgi:hypothetical protein